jgi:hypothetical protein
MTNRQYGSTLFLLITRECCCWCWCSNIAAIGGVVYVETEGDVVVGAVVVGAVVVGAVVVGAVDGSWSPLVVLWEVRVV